MEHRVTESLLKCWLLGLLLDNFTNGAGSLFLQQPLIYTVSMKDMEAAECSNLVALPKVFLAHNAPDIVLFLLLVLSNLEKVLGQIFQLFYCENVCHIFRTLQLLLLKEFILFDYLNQVGLLYLSLLQIVRDQMVLEISLRHFPVADHARHLVFLHAPLHVLLHSQHNKLFITDRALSHAHLAHVGLMILELRFGDALLTIVTHGGFSIFIILIILRIITIVAIVVLLHLHLTACLLLILKDGIIQYIVNHIDVFSIILLN